MEPDRYLSFLRADADRITAAVRTGRDRPVAACPGWTVADLAVHLGVVHRWAAEAVSTEATERPRNATATYGVDPALPELAEWYDEAATALLDVLRGADLAAPVWTFGEDKTVAFWVRRQANETLVHRVDAERALGDDAVGPIDADHAGDVVDELLVSLLPPRTPPLDAGTAPRTFHFHRTDGPGEWFVTVDGDGYRATRAHEKGDVAIRGGAADLMLFVWHRGGDGLEVFGADDAADAWFSVVPTF